MAIQDSSIDFSYLHDLGVPGLPYVTCGFCIESAIVESYDPTFNKIKRGQLVKGDISSADPIVEGFFSRIYISRPEDTDSISFGIVVDDRSLPNYEGKNDQYHAPSATNAASFYSEKDILPVMRSGIILLEIDVLSYVIPFDGIVGVYKDTVPELEGTFTTLKGKLSTQVDYFDLSSIRLLAAPQETRNGEIVAPARVNLKGGATFLPPGPEPLLPSQLSFGWLQDTNLNADTSNNITSWIDIGENKPLLPVGGGTFIKQTDGSADLTGLPINTVSGLVDKNFDFTSQLSATNFVLFVITSRFTTGGPPFQLQSFLSFSDPNAPVLANLMNIRLLLNDMSILIWDENGILTTSGAAPGAQAPGLNNLMVVEMIPTLVSGTRYSIEFNIALNGGVPVNQPALILDTANMTSFGVSTRDTTVTPLARRANYKTIRAYKNLSALDITNITTDLKTQYSIP